MPDPPALYHDPRPYIPLQSRETLNFQVEERTTVRRSEGQEAAEAETETSPPIEPARADGRMTKKRGRSYDCDRDVTRCVESGVFGPCSMLCKLER